MSTSSPVNEKSIVALTDAVNGLVLEVRTLHTKMFGDPARENAQGRIPRLEAAAESHENRIGELEDQKERFSGAKWMIAMAVGGVDLLYHVVSISFPLLSGARH